MSTSIRRREILGALCAGPALLAVSAAFAQVPAEGADYTVLASPQTGDSPGKIEVLDFFWYGCPHCYAFLPELEAWRKRLPADVVYKHVPVAFDAQREPHSKIFYALQVLGRADDLHTKVFDAYHLQHRRLLEADDVADFMAGNGIAREKWLAAYNSFTVAGLVNRSRLMAQGYMIDGTPTLAIAGRYLTSPTIVRSHTNSATLACADFLVERARREQPRSKA